MPLRGHFSIAEMTPDLDMHEEPGRGPFLAHPDPLMLERTFEE